VVGRARPSWLPPVHEPFLLMALLAEPADQPVT
jgi:hypothetical protein